MQVYPEDEYPEEGGGYWKDYVLPEVQRRYQQLQSGPAPYHFKQNYPPPAPRRATAPIAPKLASPTPKITEVTTLTHNSNNSRKEMRSSQTFANPAPAPSLRQPPSVNSVGSQDNDDGTMTDKEKIQILTHQNQNLKQELYYLRETLFKLLEAGKNKQ